MLEKEIEQYLKKRVEAVGGLCIKFTSPSMRGVPDRIVVHNGSVWFVELKAPREEPRPNQRKVRAEFQKRGITVLVLASKEDVDGFVEGILL